MKFEITNLSEAWRMIDKPKEGDDPLPCHVAIGNNFDWISDALLARLVNEAKWSFINGFDELCVFEHADYPELTCICDKDGKILKSGRPFDVVVTQKRWISCIPGILEKWRKKEGIKDPYNGKTSIFSETWDDWEIWDGGPVEPPKTFGLLDDIKFIYGGSLTRAVAGKK